MLDILSEATAYPHEISSLALLFYFFLKEVTKLESVVC